MRFAKYQALGNDYLVLDDREAGELPTRAIRRICDRHRGLGSDGILLADWSGRDPFALRIFNPDGSEAEKSGNGLRIFARFLFDEGLVTTEPFAVVTRGGRVVCEVERPDSVRVEMGRVSFRSSDIPVAGADREVLQEVLEVAGQTFRFSAATVGNPHCVIVERPISSERARELGPLIESHPSFPRRTNVQFVEVADRQTIRLEIWERGAGYTLASGSSSCAAAAVAVKLGLCRSPVEVRMPGGTLEVMVHDDFSAELRGPVVAVARGCLSMEMISGSLATAPRVAD